MMLKIVTRKERWGLSCFGYLLLFLVTASAFVFAFFQVYPFLALTRRVDSKVLVVEGWIQEYAIVEAAKEINSGRYERVFTTGGPIVGMGGYTNDYNTSASVGAERLRGAGVRSDLLQSVPARVNQRDRTYAAAVALREWTRVHDTPLTSFNVMTETTHARRTLLLYRQAFPKESAIGVIAIANPDYDGRHWWQFSEGVRDVISEALAYAYAKLFFRPNLGQTNARA
jgi:uncharacterized SAM-binding protein YcdF (DUF218 family)